MTLFNLIEMFKTDKWDLNDDYIHFLDKHIKDNKAIIIASSGLVLVITFFFLVPVTILMSVHIKNFC